ncbi:hypothetical protein QUF80_01235, partial [Desulfococcaceae bacterium HSG8]|nr:hypothetical protein [Desulfococcaceae bacterium HSG8]
IIYSLWEPGLLVSIKVKTHRLQPVIFQILFFPVSEAAESVPEPDRRCADFRGIRIKRVSDRIRTFSP